MGINTDRYFGDQRSVITVIFVGAGSPNLSYQQITYINPPPPHP